MAMLYMRRHSSVEALETVFDAQEMISLCNEVLAYSGIVAPATTVQEVQAIGGNVSVFVACTEVLLGRRLENIYRSPVNKVQRSSNCAAVLSALTAALPGIDLSHILPSAVVEGDLVHISSMLELLAELTSMPQVFDKPKGDISSSSQEAAAATAEAATGPISFKDSYSCQRVAGRQQAASASDAAPCKASGTAKGSSKAAAAAARCLSNTSQGTNCAEPRSSSRKGRNPTLDSHSVAAMTAATAALAASKDLNAAIKWAAAVDSTPAVCPDSAICPVNTANATPGMQLQHIYSGKHALQQQVPWRSSKPPAAAAAAAFELCQDNCSMDQHQVTNFIKAEQSMGTAETAAATAAAASAAARQPHVDLETANCLDSYQHLTHLQDVALSLAERQAAYAMGLQLLEQQKLQKQQTELHHPSASATCVLENQFSSSCVVQQSEDDDEGGCAALPAVPSMSNDSNRKAKALESSSNSVTRGMQCGGSAAEEAVECIDSHCHLVHLQEVALTLAGMQLQQQQLLQQQEAAEQLCQQAEAAAATAQATRTAATAATACANEGSTLQDVVAQFQNVLSEMHNTEQQLLAQHQQLTAAVTAANSAAAHAVAGGSCSMQEYTKIPDSIATNACSGAAGNKSHKSASKATKKQRQQQQRHRCQQDAAIQQHGVKLKAAAGLSSRPQTAACNGLMHSRCSSTVSNKNCKRQQLARPASARSATTKMSKVAAAAGAGRRSTQGQAGVAACMGSADSKEAIDQVQSCNKSLGIQQAHEGCMCAAQRLSAASMSGACSSAMHELQGEDSCCSWDAELAAKLVGQYSSSAGSSAEQLLWSAGADSCEARNFHLQQQQQQQQDREAKAAAAAVKVAVAKARQEAASQRLLQQQILKQQAAAARRLSAQRLQQETLSSKQEVYELRISMQQQQQCMLQQQQQQQQAHLQRKAAARAAEAKACCNEVHRSWNAGGRAASQLNWAPAAAKAVGRLKRQGLVAAGQQCPARRGQLHQSPTKQAYLCTSEVESCASAAFGAFVRTPAAASAEGSAAAAAQGAMAELQQLREDYQQVLGVFEGLLVSERRGRMEAERSLSQLVRQLRAEGKAGSRCSSRGGALDLGGSPVMHW